MKGERRRGIRGRKERERHLRETSQHGARFLQLFPVKRG